MTHYCGRKTRRCRRCGHRYPKEERALDACPECGEPRACRKTVLREGDACRLHGGASLSGVAHPNWNGGRTSKLFRSLPARMQDGFRASRDDPEILNLSNDIAVLDARLLELLGKADTRESGAAWERLADLRAAFLAAQRRQDQQAMADALADILNLIARGRGDWALWGEVSDLLERRRRLVDSEQKRRVQMQMLVKVEEAGLAMDFLADSVREAVLERVGDPDEQRAVLAHFQRALDRVLRAGQAGE